MHVDAKGLSRDRGPRRNALLQPRVTYRLLTTDHIAQAIKDAQDKLARRTETTLEGLVADCVEVQELALQGTPAMDRYGNPTGQVVRQLSAAKAAIELRAKLTGFLIERRENTNKSLDDMNEAELRAELAKEQAKQDKLRPANGNQTAPDGDLLVTSHPHASLTH